MKKILKYIIPIISVILIFWVSSNFWAAFVISAIFLTIYSYILNPNNFKNNFYKGIVLSLVVGFISNYLYNRVYPADQKEILDITRNNNIKLDSIHSEVISVKNSQEESKKLDFELDNIYRSDITDNTFKYINNLIKDGNNYELVKSKITDKLILSDLPDLKLIGFSLLSQKDSSYKDKFVQTLPEYVNYISKLETFNSNRYNVLYNAFRTKNLLDEGDILSFNQTAIPFLSVDFTKYDNKLILYRLILNLNNHFNTKLYNNNFNDYLTLIQFNNQLGYNYKYHLNQLSQFCPQQFFSMLFSTYGEICSKELSEDEFLTRVEYFNYGITFIDDAELKSGNLCENILGKYYETMDNGFETKSYKDLQFEVCRVMGEICKNNRNGFSFWLDNENLNFSNMEQILNKIENNNL